MSAPILCQECGKTAEFTTTTVTVMLDEDDNEIATDEHHSGIGFCSDAHHAQWAIRNGAEPVHA